MYINTCDILTYIPDTYINNNNNNDVYVNTCDISTGIPDSEAAIIFSKP